MATLVPNNTCSIFRLAGKDDTETSRVITGAVTIDDVTHCYVAKMPPVVGGDQYILVGRDSSLAAGATADVNITVNAKDDRGVDIMPLVVAFTLAGPPLPPAATHVVVSEGPFGRDKIGFTPPADPGSGTIAL